MEASLLTGPLTQVPTHVLAHPAGRLENKIRTAQASAGPGQNEELKKVSQEFEAIFIAQLLKVMRETIEESGLTEGGFGKSIYTELFDQEVALSMARRGALGISDLLYRNLLDQNSQSTTGAGSPVPEGGAGTTASPASEGNQGGTELDISDLQLPVQAPVSSRFGLRKDPFTGRTRFHKGLDLSAPEGMTVVPALPGTVVSARYENGYGNTVVVRHSGGLLTRYGHLGSIRVKAGDVIDSAAALGTVGSTGRSTGPHLHFEVIRSGERIDPSTLHSLNSHQSILKTGG